MDGCALIICSVSSTLVGESAGLEKAVSASRMHDNVAQTSDIPKRPGRAAGVTGLGERGAGIGAGACAGFAKNRS